MVLEKALVRAGVVDLAAAAPAAAASVRWGRTSLESIVSG